MDQGPFSLNHFKAYFPCVVRYTLGNCCASETEIHTCNGVYRVALVTKNLNMTDSRPPNMQ